MEDIYTNFFVLAPLAPLGWYPGGRTSARAGEIGEFKGSQ